MIRDPYVGYGADGARRSAAIDREELDTMPAMPTSSAEATRAAELLESAEAWDRQARDLDELEDLETGPYCGKCCHHHDPAERCACPDCGRSAPCRTHGYAP